MDGQSRLVIMVKNNELITERKSSMAGGKFNII